MLTQQNNASSMNQKIDMGLSMDNKLEIQRLIARTNETDFLHSPSKMLPCANQLLEQMQPLAKKLKTIIPDNKSSNTAGLKYLDGFTNPYVKIILVCKICNKEQKSLHPPNWKQHYMTHEEKKPHSCTHCSKSFVRADYLRKHIESQHT